MTEKIIHMIESIVGNNDIDVSLNSSLKEDIGMNSYEKVQLMGMLEEEFDMTISNKQMRQFNTIQDIIDYFQS